MNTAALRRTIIVVSCVGLTLASVFIWRFVQSQANHRQLAKDETAFRIRAEHGDAEAQFKLGSIYSKGKGVPTDFAEAVRWYRKAAEQGYAKAQFNLGQMYFRGQGVGKDYAEALKWIQRAADQSNARAEGALGFMYYNGQAVAQDYAEAARWYRKAAEQGDVDAQHGLAYIYYNGQGVPQDYAEAARWYRKAAEQGEVVAQETLGYMYATGRGVPIERSEAIAWYRKAANQGDAKAKHALESLEGSGLIGIINFELLSALIGFPVGLWLFLGSLLGGRKLQSGRQAAIAVLGLVFLAHAGLSLYVFCDNTSYWLHKDVFDIARWLLNATAVLIIITVVLRPRRREDKSVPATRRT